MAICSPEHAERTTNSSADTCRNDILKEVIQDNWEATLCNLAYPHRKGCF